MSNKNSHKDDLKLPKHYKSGKIVTLTYGGEIVSSTNETHKVEKKWFCCETVLKVQTKAQAEQCPLLLVNWKECSFARELQCQTMI